MVITSDYFYPNGCNFKQIIVGGGDEEGYKAVIHQNIYLFKFTYAHTNNKKY